MDMMLTTAKILDKRAGRPIETDDDYRIAIIQRWLIVNAKHKSKYLLPYKKDI